MIGKYVEYGHFSVHAKKSHNNVSIERELSRADYLADFYR
jgi:hypothetical protein